MSYLCELSAQVSQIVYSAHLTVLRLFTTVWAKTSKSTYLREFSAQVSQIVFSAYLTVLRLLTSIWCKTSKILFLIEFSAQVSEIMFSAQLTGLRPITTVRVETSRIPSPWVQCRSIRTRVFSFFDHFTAFHNFISFNSKNLISPWV